MKLFSKFQYASSLVGGVSFVETVIHYDEKINYT